MSVHLIFKSLDFVIIPLSVAFALKKSSLIIDEHWYRLVLLLFFFAEYLWIWPLIIATFNLFQKSNLSSTFRRLGEELYRSKTVRFYDTDPYTITDVTTSPVKTDKTREGIYFRSANQHVRLISSLIILRTLSQGK